MKNIVECKMCNKEFEYSPGFAGNARQLCDTCRNIADNEDIKKMIDSMIIEGNKYIVNTLKRKEVYDSFSIMTEGILPEIKTDADRFICATEFGKFISRTGIIGYEKNIVKFFNYIGLTHSVICLKELPMQILNQIIKNNIFSETKEYAVLLYNDIIT